jgi:rSAM/selenodomain-associated transferase 1
VALFVREAIAGRVKTRLAAAIGPSAAAEIYAAMQRDSIELVRALVGEAGVLVYDGAPPTQCPGRWTLLAQEGADLGERLRHASRELQRRQKFPVLFLGSDSPDLPRRHLRSAMRALRTHDVALGATPDGGVWCIGLRRACAELLSEIPWSSPDTGAALRNRVQEHELKLAELDPWQDVDELGDLVALAARIAADPETAPHTARWLREHDGPWRRRAQPGRLGDFA